MAPAVPFALLGVVQLTAVAVWFGLAAAACFPRLQRRTTPLIVIGALAVGVAEALTALRLDTAHSDPLAWLRFGGLVLVALGLVPAGLQPPITAAPVTALPAIIAPLGAHPTPAILGGAAGAAAAGVALVRGLRRDADWQLPVALSTGLLFTGVAAGLADPAASHLPAALALLAARAAGSLALAVALVLLARANLLGKLVGAIVASVVVMAIGAVAVVGPGVASEIQHDQSQRLLSVAKAEQKSLGSLETRASLLATIVAVCPLHRLGLCISLIGTFSSDPDYFVALDVPGVGLSVVAPDQKALDKAAQTPLAGNPVVRAALKRSATPARAAGAGAVLLGGSRPALAVVASVPVRPAGAGAHVKPKFASIYGITLTDSYLKPLSGQIGYDVSVVAGNRVVASSLRPAEQAQVQAVAVRTDVGDTGPIRTQVVPAQGQAPTVAFVPVTQAGNDDLRLATLAISQPASIALAAQRNLLRRLMITALAVLLVVALLSFLLGQRIADPVRRLTVAANRVRAGNLNAAVAVGGRDEVGSLSRAFDAMTSSLRRLTDDLRQAVTQEAGLRARLETVVESLTDGLLTTDADDVVTSANPTALALLGRDATDLIGRKLPDALDVRGNDGTPLLDRRTDVRLGTDALLHRDDGTEVPVRLALAPLTDEPGRVVVVSDRTREREVERLKTEFLSNVGHELRSPLTPIRGYAEMLARRPDLPTAQIKEFVGEILAGTARMNRAVELLMDVAALEAGRVMPRRRTVTVTAVVNGRLEDWRARYPERAGDFRRRVTAKLPALDVDADWLAKALDELADNAVKYTPVGTPITLAATPAEAGQVRLAVRDAGAGIDTSRLAELLGDFSQADASETRHVGGMGLGLGFVTRVAAQLGVTLHVTSTPGRGSDFALDVPAASPPARRRGQKQ